jgi:AcrR family transcriptional regulator
MQERCSRSWHDVRVGVRAESRERTVAEVMKLGRRQLAEVGAPALSLRAIARQLGLVSSAVYRYFPSRDALLTALIIDAFNELGETVEAAEARVARANVDERILAISRAMRCWALANPNEYALIFGSPVPGYVAPPDTIAPAARIPALLIGVLAALPEAGSSQREFPAKAGKAIRPLREQMAPTVEVATLSLGYTFWEFLVGAVSMEAFGHQTNVIEADPKLRADFFDAQVRSVANLVMDSSNDRKSRA